jgi:hypothetical protein
MNESLTSLRFATKVCWLLLRSLSPLTVSRSTTPPSEQQRSVLREHRAWSLHHCGHFSFFVASVLICASTAIAFDKGMATTNLFFHHVFLYNACYLLFERYRRIPSEESTSARRNPACHSEQVFVYDLQYLSLFWTLTWTLGVNAAGYFYDPSAPQVH